MAAKLLTVLALTFCACTCAAAYPERPIRLVVPAPAGGAIDVVGRIVGQKLSEVLQQNIVIDNRAGANNINGTEIAARAAPDGCTPRPSLHRRYQHTARLDELPPLLFNNCY